MSVIFNEQPVLGVRLVADGTKMFNGLRVIGVRAVANGVLFVGNLRTRGVDVLGADKPIHNDHPVRGAVLIADARTLYNGQLVIPANAQSGVLA